MAQQKELTPEFDILYEDDHLLVINKPAGMVVNRSESCQQLTVQDWMIEKYPHIFANLSSDSELFRRFGLAHRLDKDTSGVLLLAKSEDVLIKLLISFKKHLFKKEYQAFAWGVLPQPELRVDAPIGRNPRFRRKQAVVSDGKISLTDISLIQSYPNFKDTGFDACLVKVFPKTGRTHQIRVHLAALGCPIVGDILYSGKRRTRLAAKFTPKMLLHAAALSFTHPVSNELLQIKAPLPDYFKKLIV